MKNDLQKICTNIGIAILALVMVATFILTPIAFIYNWDGFLKTLFIVIDILFYIIIYDLIYAKSLDGGK